MSEETKVMTAPQIIKVIRKADSLDALREIGSLLNTNWAAFRPAREAKKIARAFRSMRTRLTLGTVRDDRRLGRLASK